MGSKYRYVRINESEVPSGVRFDAVRSQKDSGVEIAYGGFDDAGHVYGHPYRRVTERASGRVTYSVRVA